MSDDIPSSRGADAARPPRVSMLTMAFRRRNAVVTPIRIAGLCDEHKALLRQVIKEAIQSRLAAGNLDAAMDCQRLENRILDPPIVNNWDETPVGRRIAARDARDRR